MPPRNSNLETIQPSFSAKGVRDKIRGGALATKSTRDAALYSQMQAVPLGRRIVARVGLQGQLGFVSPDGLDPASPGQIYPTVTAERVMMRAKVRLTPGYTLRAVCLFLPSGPVQQFADISGTWVEGKPGGSLRINVDLFNGVDPVNSANHIFFPKVSALTWKKLPPQAGGCWSVVERLEADIIPPAQANALPGWEHVDCTITIAAKGGCRPLDVIVYEVPHRYVTDESHRETTVPNFPTAGANSEYPITAVFQGTNPIRGSQQANKSMADLRQNHGPALMQWSSWNEDTVAVTATEAAPVSITTSLGFRSLQAAAVIAYGSNNHGWSVSSGAYGRNLEQSGLLELRDVNGCIPVTLRAYARMTNAAHTGTIRFQTADYALRDLTITGSTNFGWYSGLAWIRCPVHASLDSLLQVSAKVALVGQTLEIRYLSVEFGGHYTVTQ